MKRIDCALAVWCDVSSFLEVYMATKKAVSKQRETLSSAVSKAALKKISTKSSEQFVADLKEQGINSLEDLANVLITTARSGSRSGLAFDPEDFPICYKFTTYRPRFDQRELQEIVNQINQITH
jgi:hypothetical protein